MGDMADIPSVVRSSRCPVAKRAGSRRASPARSACFVYQKRSIYANNGHGITIKYSVTTRVQVSNNAHGGIPVTHQHRGKQGEESTTDTGQHQQQQQQQSKSSKSKSKTTKITKKVRHRNNSRQARDRRREQRQASDEELNIVTHNVRTASTASKLGALCDMWDRPHKNHGMDADIVLIQEMRRQTHGTTNCGKYRVWWMHNTSSKKKDVRGVGIAIRRNVHAALGGGIPTFVNDRIVRFVGVAGGQKLTIVGAYAPTNVSEEGVSETFFEELQVTISKIPSGTAFVVGGDFNARIPHTDSSVTKFTGPLVPEAESDRNGRLMLQLAKDEQLVFLNSYFQKDNYTTYKCHDKWYTYDQFWCGTKQRKLMSNVEVLKRQGWSDHTAVACSMEVRKLMWCNRAKQAGALPAIDAKTAMKYGKEIRECCELNAKELSNKCNPVEMPLTEFTTMFKDVMINGASKLAPGKKRKKGSKTWYEAHRAVLDPVRLAKEAAYRKYVEGGRLKEGRDWAEVVRTKVVWTIEAKRAKFDYFNSQARVARAANLRGDSAAFHHTFKTSKLEEAGKTGCTQIRNKEGKIVTNEEEIREVVKQHHHEVVGTLEGKKRGDVIEVKRTVGERVVNEPMDQKISKEDARFALWRMKLNRAVGTDDIPTDILRIIADPIYDDEFGTIAFDLVDAGHE